MSGLNRRKWWRAGLAFISVLGVASAGTIIWDYGPGTGTPSDAWDNTYNFQTFADIVLFPRTASITGYNQFAASYYSMPNAYELRLWADAGGQPGALLFSTSLSATAETLIGTFTGQFFHMPWALWQISFTMPPIELQANVPYWIGITGKGGLPSSDSQWTVAGPGDGRAAVFGSGDTFQYMSLLGDQMFQLEGTLAAEPTPEPGAFLLSAIGLAYVMRRLRRRTAR